MKKLVITEALETKIKELQKEKKSLILDLTLNDAPEGIFGHPSKNAEPLVNEVFDLCYDDDYKEELERLVNIFNYEYRLGQVTAYMQLYGYEIKKPEVLTYVLYVKAGENKVYYGTEVHTATPKSCTRFRSVNKKQMQNLEELEKHGWTRQEVNLTEFGF